MLRSLRDLEQNDVLATDGKVGKVGDVLFDDATFTIRYLVVESGGLLSRRHALIAPRAVLRADWAKRELHLDLTRQRVADSPDLDADQPVSRQYEERFHRYYGWPYYWSGASLATAAPFSVAAPVLPILASAATAPADGKSAADVADAAAPDTYADEAPSGDLHLRSLREVTGYHVQGVDGAMGHVDDLLADDETWTIRYLVVNTKNWLFGKQVLVAPAWFDRFSWAEKSAYVGLPRRAIETAPEWNGGPVDRDYEARLHAHYGRPRYWDARHQRPTPEPPAQ